MDLNSILQKTKSRSEKIKKMRSPVNIATDDRPYDSIKSVITEQRETSHKLATNRLQNNDKETTNYLQTDNKVITQPTTKHQQTIFKVPANNLQTTYKTTYKNDYNIGFSDLVGIQKDLMIIFYENCKKNGEKITAPLSLDYLISAANHTIKSIKTSIYRLEKKMLILRFEFKNGRGGWTRYQIPDHIFKEISQLETNNKLTTNNLQSNNKQPTNVTTKLTTEENHYNSSSFITTIGEGWDEIDFSALEAIGFKKNHLLQLKNANTSDIVQESINHFAFALQNNKKVQGYETPLNVLITVLKRGEGWVEPNYVSPRERAMRSAIEAKKREQERVQKAEDELFDLEYKSWESQLPKEERKLIATEKLVGAAMAQLRKHFRETKWQEIKKAWS